LRSRRATLAIGFAFEEQMAEDLPLEATDQPLDMLITQNRVIEFSR
jgi:5-formyltetrahydrofolate cyclo-ligase